MKEGRKNREGGNKEGWMSERDEASKRDEQRNEGRKEGQ